MSPNEAVITGGSVILTSVTTYCLKSLCRSITNNFNHGFQEMLQICKNLLNSRCQQEFYVDELVLIATSIAFIRDHPAKDGELFRSASFSLLKLADKTYSQSPPLSPSALSYEQGSAVNIKAILLPFMPSYLVNPESLNAGTYKTTNLRIVHLKSINGTSVATAIKHEQFANLTTVRRGALVLLLNRAQIILIICESYVIEIP
jgi:hypothetical protein